MNIAILYPPLLMLIGLLVSKVVLVFLNRSSKKVIKFFQLYPESKSVLSISLKLISWFVTILVFLVFLSVALQLWGIDSATKLLNDFIGTSPKYILAVLIILAGFYVSRIVKERSKDYIFEYKNSILMIIDFIIHMTFIFTALYSIGVNVLFFIEFYKVVLWILGAIVIVIASMTIGIPLGFTIYERMKNEKKLRKGQA